MIFNQAYIDTGWHTVTRTRQLHWTYHQSSGFRFDLELALVSYTRDFLDVCYRQILEQEKEKVAFSCSSSSQKWKYTASRELSYDSRQSGRVIKGHPGDLCLVWGNWFLFLWGAETTLSPHPMPNLRHLSWWKQQWPHFSQGGQKLVNAHQRHPKTLS